MAKRKNKDREEANEAQLEAQLQLDELGSAPGEVGPDSAGQSGDPQGLSCVEDASDESVKELAESDQALEAEVLQGVEDAADRPEKPVRTHQDYPREDDIPPKDGSPAA